MAIDLQILVVLVQIVQQLLSQGLFKHFKNLHSTDENNSQTQQVSSENQDEHLETDIIDDEDDLESNNLKINQINILQSQASASAPLSIMSNLNAIHGVSKPAHAANAQLQVPAVQSTQHNVNNFAIQSRNIGYLQQSSPDARERAESLELDDYSSDDLLALQECVRFVQSIDAKLVNVVNLHIEMRKLKDSYLQHTRHYRPSQTHSECLSHLDVLVKRSFSIQRVHQERIKIVNQMKQNAEVAASLHPASQ